MRNQIHHAATLLACTAVLAFSLPAAAYEVHVLTGPGSQSKAMNDGNYALAIERLEVRVKHETKNSAVQLTNLCTAYVVTRQFDKATETCDRAVAADGEFVGTAYNSRGVLHAMEGDFIAALADFQDAGDKSNYPGPRYRHGDRSASTERSSAPDNDLDEALRVAASNQVAADRQWAAIQSKR